MLSVEQHPIVLLVARLIGSTPAFRDQGFVRKRPEWAHLCHLGSDAERSLPASPAIEATVARRPKTVEVFSDLSGSAPILPPAIMAACTAGVASDPQIRREPPASVRSGEGRTRIAGSSAIGIRPNASEPGPCVRTSVRRRRARFDSKAYEVDSDLSRNWRRPYKKSTPWPGSSVRISTRFCGGRLRAGMACNFFGFEG